MIVLFVMGFVILFAGVGSLLTDVQISKTEYGLTATSFGLYMMVDAIMTKRIKAVSDRRVAIEREACALACVMRPTIGLDMGGEREDDAFYAGKREQLDRDREAIRSRPKIS